LLIEALALLPALSARAKDVRVVIVGDGPMRERLQAVAAAQNVAPQVFFAGAQTHVPHWLQSLDVFCLPSRAEGISNTVLEAMGCGLPVIATRVGGNPELVRDGQTGTLIPHSNAQALAKQMARYLEKPELIRQQGDAGLKRVHAEFSLPAMIARYTQLYRSMAGR
jgi:glycosyltransferase involved in cell wall biosynthesis